MAMKLDLSKGLLPSSMRRGAEDSCDPHTTWRAETAQVLSGTAGAVSVAPCRKGSVLLAGMVTVAKDLSVAKETEPTVSILSAPCASQVSSPERRKHAKARQKAARNI